MTMSRGGMSGPMTMKRINREMADIAKEDLGGMTLTPNEKNIFEWKATIPGPEGSVYEGGVFNVDISLPPDYPFSAPKATFVTRIYHMNISERGQVCVDLLKHNWSPALSLFKVMLSLSSLLTDPNPKDPLVPTIATEYNRRRAQHDLTARQWTELYAKPRGPVPPTPSPAPAVATTSRARHAIHNGNPRPPLTDPEVISLLEASHCHRAHVPRSTTNGSSTSMPIDISDDESTSQPQSRKRKAPSTGQGRQKRRSGETEGGGRSVIVIDD